MSNWTRNPFGSRLRGHQVLRRQAIDRCIVRPSFDRAMDQASSSASPSPGSARRCAIAAASRRFGASSLRRMCETWTLAVFTLDHERVGDLPVGVAAGDEREHLGLPRRQAEGLLQESLSIGRRSVRRGEIEPRTLGEQLELPSKRLRSCPSRDRVCRPQRHARLSARRASCDERLGLPPAAEGREGRRSSPSQVTAASDRRSGRATPRTRSYSASARACRPRVTRRVRTLAIVFLLEVEVPRRRPQRSRGRSSRRRRPFSAVGVWRERSRAGVGRRRLLRAGCRLGRR